ncbi:hypothetical protein ABT213_33670 [Streptomyces sp. NPDC001674]|uniref:hypothetical protein n=1 Tax=Streptomyces sp. NPDC001674 TaxID=3154394 RepID=UPI0033195CB2
MAEGFFARCEDAQPRPGDCGGVGVDIYAPPRLRAVQPLRPFLPFAVTAVSRWALPRLNKRGSPEPIGLLGAGGQADLPSAADRAGNS